MSTPQALAGFGSAITNSPPAMPVSFVRIETTDAIQQAECLPLWRQEYSQLSGGRFAGSITEASLESVQVFRETMNQVVDQKGQPWEDCYAFGVPLDLKGGGAWNFKSMAPDCIFGLLPNEELSFRTPRYSDIYVAVIDARECELYGERTGSCDVAQFLRRSRVRSCSHSTASRLRALFGSILEQVGSNPAILNHPSARKSLIDGIIDAVLLSISEVGGRESVPVGHQIHRNVVNRAREYVLSRRSEPPSVAELCAYLRMSRRGVHYCFMNVLGINPVTFLRYVRLHGVRQDLLKAGPEPASIGEVAMSWGFWHLGMFASYYKALYGELPSMTVKRLPRPRVCAWPFAA